MLAKTFLPHWDMSPFFPSLESGEYAEAFQQLNKTLDEMESAFAVHGIARLNDAEPCDQATFELVVSMLNEAGDLFGKLRAYVNSFTDTDSRNALALARASELDKPATRFAKLAKRFVAWLGTSDPTELLSTGIGREYRFVIEQAKVTASHQMETDLEMLASDMEVTGSTAWRKLYNNFTSQISVTVMMPDGPDAIPMSATRALATHPDRTVRKAAFEAELAAWKQNEIPIAASLNAMKGETLLLGRMRKWESTLDSSLFGANIDRETLDAMMAAARESFPAFRRYMKAKARGLGIQTLAFYDLFAPLPKRDSSWEYEEAMTFVRKEFGAYSGKLGGFASRAFDEQWIDAEPRPGKVDGAYCMRVTPGVSRILMNHRSSFTSVSTLAHELGHAYHNLCLQDRPAMLRTTPMTLAETASIFCETIVRKAVLAGNDDALKLEVLDASLQGNCQVVVDISSRFLFESALLERRQSRELNPAEMCELMLQAQRDTYGDGLDQEALHPYMWAAKSHYYGRSFYNYPYMFGLLFGLGLYQVYAQEGVAFQSRYDELLGATGTDDAATLAARFGIDIRSKDFWRGSLALIEQDIDQFETMV